MDTTNNILDANDFHLGKLIKEEMMRQGRTSVWLAKQVHCTPENIYKIYRQQWITIPMLLKISIALDYDFFGLCSDYFDACRRGRCYKKSKCLA